MTRVGAHLPAHHLTIIAWPKTPRTAAWPAVERVYVDPTFAWTSSSAPSSRRASWPEFDARIAGWVSGCVAWLDEHTRFDEHGEPANWLSSRVDRFTDFSTAALYERGAFGTALCERTLAALCEEPIDLVVAHSFGGTVALRSAWYLAHVAELPPVHGQFQLITLGTASGPTVTRSLMFGSVPRRGDKIALSPCIARWQHFVSPSDAFVGQGMLPRGFDGVEQVNVQTGAFIGPGRGHALSAYLATPEVLHAIQGALTPAARALAAVP